MRGYLEVERARQAIAEHLVVEIGKVLDVSGKTWAGSPPAIEYGPKKA